MIYRYSKSIGISLMLLIFLTGTIDITYASVSMEELRAQFYKETRIKWSKATSEERSDFMYKIRGREKKEEREERVKGVVTPFYIRERFKREYERVWEDATEDEQESFIDDYKSLQRQWEHEEKEKIREKKIRLRKSERAKRSEEKRLRLKKREKEKKSKRQAKGIREKA